MKNQSLMRQQAQTDFHFFGNTVPYLVFNGILWTITFLFGLSIAYMPPYTLICPVLGWAILGIIVFVVREKALKSNSTAESIKTGDTTDWFQSQLSITLINAFFSTITGANVAAVIIFT